MGRKELSSRANWQVDAWSMASQSEQNLFGVFQSYFSNTEYKILKKPRHLQDLYGKTKLDEDVLRTIYTPDIDISTAKWGIIPDFAIENTRTGKILFGENKRQDGWVEGKSPSAGRGNAHERLCKLFTPGLQRAYRRIGKIASTEILPFFVVFMGDITRDPKRVREIAFWFDRYKYNYFMWRLGADGKPLIEHFERYLKKHLD